MNKATLFLDALKKEFPNMLEVKDGAPVAEFWESFDEAYADAEELTRLASENLQLKDILKDMSERLAQKVELLAEVREELERLRRENMKLGRVADTAGDVVNDWNLYGNPSLQVLNKLAASLDTLDGEK